MAIAKRTEITIETQTLTVIRTRRTAEHILCSRCSAIALPLTLAEAGAAMGLTDVEVASRLESGVFHRIEHNGRTLKICGNSLTERKVRD